MEPLDSNQTPNNSLEDEIKEWKNQINLLSYEDSLHQLDLLLENLQNDSVPLDELQEYHLKGSIYLEHCQKLLKKTEHRVIEIDTNSLEQ